MPQVNEASWVSNSVVVATLFMFMTVSLNCVLSSSLSVSSNSFNFIFSYTNLV